MNSRDFVYWLHGFFELSGSGEGLTKEQTEMVKRHLDLVFKNETARPTSGVQYGTPTYDRTGDDPQRHQARFIC